MVTVRVGHPDYNEPETQRYICEDVEVKKLQDDVFAVKLIGLAQFEGVALDQPADFTVPVYGAFGIE